MLLVVDANVICSFLVAGKSVELLFSPKLELCTPELLFAEVKKHDNELKAKSRLSNSEFDILLILLEKKIAVIPMDRFIARLPEAESLLDEHKKDAPYIALALEFNCPLWSYEKRLKKLPIDCLTTGEVIKRLS